MNATRKCAKNTYCSIEIISRFGIRFFGNQTIFPSSKPISRTGSVNIYFPPFAYVIYKAIKYFVKKELKSILYFYIFGAMRCNTMLHCELEDKFQNSFFHVKNNEAKQFELVQCMYNVVYTIPDIVFCSCSCPTLLSSSFLNGIMQKCNNLLFKVCLIHTCRFITD